MPAGLVVGFRRGAGRVKRWLAPRPEMAAWRHACRLADRTPRYTPGEIQLLDYTLRYPDLLTLCPQWHDIFVRQSLKFSTSVAAPRILDCGANAGLASLYFKRIHPGARITAFEADPALHDVLARNLQQNGAADVEAVHAAVWTADGAVTFTCEGADSGAIAALAPGLRGTDRTVPSRRLRDLLARERVDLLKLDIEGAECAVLEDCEPALDRVGALLVDAHEFDPRARTLPRVLAVLERAGFTYALDGLEPQPWRSPVQGPGTPFPGASLCWTMLVRAWRAGAREMAGA